MNKISVNTLSYKRDKVLTLDYLPFINLWVCETEYDKYKEAHPEANIIKIKKGIQGNVSRVRNYILDKEFEENDAVCLLDDDIAGIYRHEINEANGGALSKKIEKDDFLEFLEKYTMLCDEWGFKLWGLALNKDKLIYYQNCPFNTKSMILGPFGVHLKNDIRYDESLYLKEDYDLAIQHLEKHRGILRVNSYFYDCKQSVIKGGCAGSRNVDKEVEQFNLLQKKWGSKIVRMDKTVSHKSKKGRIHIDYNPIVRVPINGV